jgi:hypothetical protein
MSRNSVLGSDVKTPEERKSIAGFPTLLSPWLEIPILNCPQIVKRIYNSQLNALLLNL